MSVMHKLDPVGENLVKKSRIPPCKECENRGGGYLELFGDFKSEVTPPPLELVGILMEKLDNVGLVCGDLRCIP